MIVLLRFRMPLLSDSRVFPNASEVTGEDLLSLEGAILLSDIRMDELQKGDFAGLDSLKLCI